MSLDLLKEARELLMAGVSAAESLFGRHATATASVSTDLDALKAQFSDLLTKVDAAISGIEASMVAKPVSFDDLKALIAKL